MTWRKNNFIVDYKITNLSKNPDVTIFKELQNETLCHIEQLSVSSDKRGQGQGTEGLISFLEHITLTQPTVSFVVLSANHYNEDNEESEEESLEWLYKLISFYEKIGFMHSKDKGTFTTNYPDDTVDMKYDLKLRT